ncbi:HAD hydrolase family protein [Dyadobacter frigoris]|nr:HAD hydrolase family protein [Dyadobacter frigoris]GLU51210.1 hypothetical protein Dfri01_06710 [Dyadobacter frigoris]
MPLTNQQKQQISDFSDRIDLIEQGGLITDLDGTLIRQDGGRYFMPDPVSTGLQGIYNTNCPVVINSIRFPLSVINTFAKQWFSISKVSVPLVTLNGSQTGYIHKDKKGGFTFEEVESFPLGQKELASFISDLENITEGGGNALAFYYPRDWKKGEIIWTADPDKVAETKQKYKSASHVHAGDIKSLDQHLGNEDISMIFLLDLREDSGIPARHSDHKDFYTAKNVNKSSGAKNMVKHLDRQIHHFIGAGDTPMDVFLKEVGLALKVGRMDLGFECKSPVVQIDHIEDIGDVFNEIAISCTRSKILSDHR